MKFLDKIVKIAPLFSVIIIFLSVVKYSIFYNAFNIKIIHFLSLTELITIFLNDIVMMVVFLFLMTFSLFFLTDAVTFKESSNGSEPQAVQADSISKHKFNRTLVKVNKYGVPLGFIFLFGATFYRVYTGHVPISIGILYGGIMGVLAIVFTFLLFFRPTLPNKWYFLFDYLFVAFVLGLVLVIWAYHDISVVKDEKPNLVYEIKLDETSITTDDRLVYVGKTENFIFLYNKTDRTSTVLRMTDVEKIYISEVQ